MFESLPEPDGRPFPGGLAPVQTVVFSLDFQQERPPESDDGIVWRRLLAESGLKTARISQASQQSVHIDPTAAFSPRNVTRREGWVVHLDDGISNSGLYSTGVNLERFQYPGYDAFRGECERLIDATLSLLKPKVQTRIGLSYSNALSDEGATSATFWREKVQPAFLGPILSDGLVSSYKSGVAVYAFESDGCIVDLKTALQPDRVFDGCHAFIFQSEAAVPQVTELSRDGVLATLDVLHTVLLKVFYTVMAPERIQEMRSAKAE